MSRLYVREAQVTYTRTAIAFSERVSDSSAVARVLQARIGANICESLLVLACDTSHRVLGIHEVSRGGIDWCPVQCADVFRYPLLCGAAAIIIAHNHPSGSTTPSTDDIKLTRRIMAAGKLLGIPLLDHLIITESGSYTSFLDTGFMNEGARS